MTIPRPPTPPPQGPTTEPEAPTTPERPEGFVADVPTTFDGDETEWAKRASKEADADNPALAKARARLAALARARVPPSKPR